MRKIRGRTNGRRPGSVREMSGKCPEGVSKMSPKCQLAARKKVWYDRISQRGNERALLDDHQMGMSRFRKGAAFYMPKGRRDDDEDDGEHEERGGSAVL